MNKKILMIGTLDTKGREFEYLKAGLLRNNLEVLAMDAGVLGKTYFKPDITRDIVAKKSGSNI